MFYNGLWIVLGMKSCLEELKVRLKKECKTVMFEGAHSKKDYSTYKISTTTSLKWLS